VEDQELVGYHAWLDRRYQDAVRRGMLRVRAEEGDELDHTEPEEAADGDVEAEEAEEAGEAGEAEETQAAENAAGMLSDDEDTESIRDAGDDTPDYELVGEEPDDAAQGDSPRGALSFGVIDVPLGEALVQFIESLDDEHRRDTELARHLRQLVSGGDAELIGELIERLAQGDFGAGQELLDHGRPAVEALAELLQSDPGSELADDILQILGNSGDMLAYEKIAEFFDRHGALPDDPLGIPAVRGFCYVVMITQGDPEPLRSRLAKLDTIEAPELADDLSSARSASAKWR
jgi:hypothetical protein